MSRAQADLEQRLTALGRDLRWPEEADLVAGVLAAVAEPDAVPSRGAVAPAWSWKRLGWRIPASGGGRVAVAAALSALLVLLLVPTGVPAAVARFFGVPGVAIRTVEVLPPVGEEPSWLGEPVTLGRARKRVDFTVRVLPLEGDIERMGGGVYLDERPATPIVTIAYSAQAGLPEVAPENVGAFLTQLRADVRAELFTKVLGPGTRVIAVEVSGEPGWWISGADHVLVEAGGDLVPLAGHRAGNTLLWAEDGVTYRLETALPQAGAIALAESLR